MLGKTLQERYEIISSLGSGGYGATFLALDLQQSECALCVVKQLRPQVTDPANLRLARRLFTTEAQVLRELGHHPQIPQLLDHFEEHEEFYLVQEFIDGHDLSKEITLGKQHSEAQVISVLRDTLATLAFVHQRHVIHRDIKPSNLIRRKSDQQIVMIDFGAVKQISTQTMSHAVEQTNSTVAIGTPGYMPTEQASGRPKFSSDIYAVGMVALFALTGLNPARDSFPEETDTGEIRWSHLTNVSPELVKVINKMICYDFRDRYQSVEAVLQDLRGLPNYSEEIVPPRLDDLSISSQVTTLFTQMEDTQPPQLETRLAEQLPSASRSRFIKLGIPVVTLVGLGTWFSFFSLFSAGKSSKPPSPTPIALQTPASPTTQAGDFLNQGNQLRQLEKNPEALAAYNQALKLDPHLKSAWWGQCYELNVLQRYEQALKACWQALNLDPNYVDALTSKGYALNALQRYQEAIAIYNQALKIKPDNFQTYVNRGATLYKLKQYNEALADYNQALKFKPDFAEAWNNKGAVLADLSQYQAALSAYDKALQFKPNYPEAWNNRGVVFGKMKRYQEAVTSYEKAIQLRPDYSLAKQNRQEAVQVLKQFSGK